jgi:tRNA wybutosine-synthesizing protein 3
VTAALQSGFRESGTVNVASKGLPMAAVRSMGLGFDSIIGYQDAMGKTFSVVDAAYLSNMIRIARVRFQTNAERTQRFHENLERAYKINRRGGHAEELKLEKELRSRRKREEGLAVQKEARNGDRVYSAAEDPVLVGLFD